jgi:ATP-binding cassette subfamily C protein LapB
LVPIGFVVVMLLIGFSLSRQSQKVQEMITEEANRKQGFLIESMDGIESIKATGGESQLLHRWHQILQKLSPQELVARNISTNVSSMTSAIQQVTYVSTVAIGAMLIHDSKLTMGGLIACSILGGRILSPLIQIPQLLLQWSGIKMSLTQLNRIMAMPSDQDNLANFVTPSNISATLEAEDIQFGYYPEQISIQVPKLSLSAGDSVAVLGRVGSGKSTLLKVLSGLYQPNQGRILFSGIDERHLSPDFLREQVGYLPQEVRLIKGTLKENLILGLPFATDSEILAAAEKVGLDRLIKAHPAGLSLPLAEGGLGLSGGQKQMVALARLFLAKPQVLLLDEPTASLDRDLEIKVLQELFAWMGPEKILLIVTHKPQVLQYVSKIMIVEGGKILKYGERQEMLNLMQGKPLVQNQVTPTPNNGNQT